MKIKILRITLVLLSVSFTTKAQFNTILKEKDIVNLKIDNSRNIDKVEIKPKQESEFNPKLDSLVNIISKRNLISLPLDTLFVTSSYGVRTDPINKKKKYHNGVDFRGNHSTIYSVFPGVVKKIGKDNKSGNYILLECGDYTIGYAHMYLISVKKGDILKAGEKLGITGSTGRSTGDHLHLTIRHRNKLTDPMPILKAINSYIIYTNKKSEELLR